MPPSFSNKYLCNHQNGHGIPNLSKFLDTVNKLGSLVNTQAAPKKLIFKSKAQTAKSPYHASLIAVCGIPISIIFSKLGIFPLISHLNIFNKNRPSGPRTFLFFWAILSVVEIIISLQILQSVLRSKQLP